jgi:hypothetical protein
MSQSLKPTPQNPDHDNAQSGAEPASGQDSAAPDKPPSLGDRNDPGDQPSQSEQETSAVDTQAAGKSSDHETQQPQPGEAAAPYHPLLEIPRWAELLILVSGLILVIGTTAAQILLPALVAMPNRQPAEAYASRKLNTATYVITLLVGSLFTLVVPLLHGVEAELRRRHRRYLKDLGHLR